jgi:hypothetical protein
VVTAHVQEAGIARAAAAADAERVALAISRWPRRIRSDDDAALRASVTGLLATARLPYTIVPGPGEPPCMLALGSVLVEVTASGSAEQLTARLRRRAAVTPVTAIILVTPVAAHRAVPPDIDGAPVRVVWVHSAGLPAGTPGAGAVAAAALGSP